VYDALKATAACHTQHWWHPRKKTNTSFATFFVRVFFK